MVSCLSALGILIGRSRRSKALAGTGGLRPDADVIGGAVDERKWASIRTSVTRLYAPTMAMFD